MRVWLAGIAILLAGSSAMLVREPLAQERQPATAADPSAITALRRSIDSANRQSAFEERIAKRNQWKSRAICEGCGGRPARPSRSADATSHEAGEMPIADPAQAPLD